MRLSDFAVLSFDTYGTLIDWEAGLSSALAGLTRLLDPPPAADEVLERFAEAEAAAQAATPDLRYANLLVHVYRRLAHHYGVDCDDKTAEAFGQSVGRWPAFPDAADALAYLKQHVKLVTLTNCDRESYRGSDDKLRRPWDAILTAEEIGSYKPSPRNFEALVDLVRDEFGQPPEAILHVAQSLFHDHVPATAAGLRTVWIDRRYDRPGFGATAAPAGEYRIDFRFRSMSDLVAAHRAELVQVRSADMSMR